MINQDTNSEHTEEENKPEIEESETSLEQVLSENQSLIKEKNTLKAEVEEHKEKYLRLYADFENFRRRVAKEKLELTQTAAEGVMVSLIPLLDDFERAMKSMDTVTDIASVKEGINLIYTKFFKTLEQKGLKAMDSINKDFNMDIHESVTQIPAPSKELVGKVVDELEKGYYLNDKVIRFAKVVIGA